MTAATVARVSLSDYVTWEPASLLRPDLSKLWPRKSIQTLADVTTRVLPTRGFPGAIVSPSGIDRATGTATARHGDGQGWTYALQPHGNLSDGDILIAGSYPVLLVGPEMHEMQFSQMFAALRPETDTDRLWLWACLNTTAGTEVRTALTTSPTQGIRTLDLRNLPIPDPIPTWAEIRPQVLALQQQVLTATGERDRGQSWWRREDLDARGNWMQRLSGPNPDEFEVGEAVGKLASEIRVGRTPGITSELPVQGQLPVVDERNLDGRPSRFFASPDEGILAIEGDLLVPRHRGAIEAKVVTEDCIVGQSLLLLRLHEPSAGPRIIEALNSSTGQRQLRYRSAGITVPQLSTEGLSQFRISQTQDGHRRDSAVGKPPIREALDGMLWS